MAVAPLLLAFFAPGLADVGVPFGTRSYRAGQVCGHQVRAAAAVINRNFFAGSREGCHKVELIGNALRARMGTRLETGGIQLSERSSLVFGVSPERRSDIVAVAELSMQPRNGRVPGNFRPSYFSGSEPLVPYICNLAVDHAHRQRGIGRDLMAVCETIALDVW